VSAQLESPHYFRRNDRVRDRNGSFGTVIDATALFAIVSWGDGRLEEVDQFDPRLIVVERGE
jgi:hypothetical protein